MKTRSRKSRLPGIAWLGLVPFLLFGIAFEIIPVLTLARSSLTANDSFTLGHFERALTPMFVDSLRNSIQLSAATAFLGVAFGILTIPLLTRYRPDLAATLTWQSIPEAFGVALIVSVTVVLLALFFARAITQPIAQLIHVTERISLGQLDVKIEVNRKDEIGELALAVRRMEASLQAALERLRSRPTA